MNWKTCLCALLVTVTGCHKKHGIDRLIGGDMISGTVKILVAPAQSNGVQIGESGETMTDPDVKITKSDSLLPGPIYTESLGFVRLASLIRVRTGKNVEILNLAGNGLSSDQWASGALFSDLRTRYAQFKPDITVIVVGEANFDQGIGWGQTKDNFHSIIDALNGLHPTLFVMCPTSGDITSSVHYAEVEIAGEYMNMILGPDLDQMRQDHPTWFLGKHLSGAGFQAFGDQLYEAVKKYI